MIKNAIGLIETIGLAAAVEAADVAVKSANVELIGYELARGDGMTTVKILGDVGAVKAGVESAKAAAALVGKVYSTQVIPRPAQGLEALVYSNDTVGLAKEAAPVKEPPKPAEKPVEPLNVVPEIIEEIKKEEPKPVELKKEEPPKKTEQPKPAEVKAEVKKEEPKKVEPKKPEPKKPEPKKETTATTPAPAQIKKPEEKPKPGDNKTPPNNPGKK